MIDIRNLHLIEKSGRENYDDFFRDISPVRCPYWAEPGLVAVLPLRTSFSDRIYNNKRRSNRELFKGKFQKGSVAYIDTIDLSLFKTLYHKPIKEYTPEMLEYLRLFETEGPLTIHQLKDITQRFTKDITPVLHKLQAAFVIYEDQTDDGWDRPWYLINREYQLSELPLDDCYQEIIRRYSKRAYLFTAEMIASYYGLPLKKIKEELSKTVVNGNLYQYDQEHYTIDSDYRPQDFSMDYYYCLDRNDFLVKSCQTYLDKLFVEVESAHTVMYYILRNNEFIGVLLGRFTFGPYELEELYLVNKNVDIEKINEAIYFRCKDSAPINSYIYLDH